MSGDLTIFRNGGAPSTAFKGVHLPTQRLDDGVSAGFAKMSYKGSKWGIKYQGQYVPVQARMPDGSIIQSPFLDVVILRSAGHPSKAWYEGLFTEGDSAPPDCWSTNGMKPDVGVPKMQSPTCIGCQWNVWGSKVNRDTGQATRGKACMDSKRLAVVPVGDIENKFYGGPMMLNVPPTSLKRLGPYQNALEANGFHYSQVWTRIMFEPQAAYPLFTFDAMAALNDVQAGQVVKMLNHPLIERILNTELQTAEAWDEPTGATQVSMSGTQQAQPEPQPEPQPVTPVTPAQPVTAQPVQTVQTLAQQPEPQPVTPLPPSGPAPGTQPQPEPTPPPPPPEPEAAAAPSLPPGMTLPAGMTPEMAAAFMAQFQPKEGAKPNGRGRRRTPAVQPVNMDSAQPGPEATPSAPPQAAAMVLPPPPQANGSVPAAPDQAVQSIMSTVKNLL